MSQSALLDAAAALSTMMDLKKGRLAAYTETHRRKLSEMPRLFADEEKRAAAESAHDATVYEVYRIEPADDAGAHALCYAATTVYPGRVGNEYFMTRGHAHVDNGAPEIILTVRGQGMLLLQTPDEKVQALAMAAGTVLYVPGAAAHRIVNVGDEALVTFGTYPVSAGLDYSLVEGSGFKRIIVATPDGPDLAPNPQFGIAKGAT